MPTDSLRTGGVQETPIWIPTQAVPFGYEPVITGSMLSMDVPDHFRLGGDVEWQVELAYDIRTGVPQYVNVYLISDTVTDPGFGGQNLGNATVADAPTGFSARVDGSVHDRFHVEVLPTVGHEAEEAYIDVRSVTILPAGPLLPYARYTSSAAQPVSRDVDTLVAFENEATFHPLISRAEQDDGHRFTFRKGGIWAVTATTRFVGGGGAGERYSALVSNSDNPVSGRVITANGGYNGSAPETTNLSYTGYFPVNTFIEVSTWQNGGDSLNLEGVEGWKNITFALIAADPA
jgi:hypothetical protein